jgi:hypothetical protein
MMGYSHEIEEKVQAARDSELTAGLTTYWLDVLLAGCGEYTIHPDVRVLTSAIQY